MPTSMSSRSGVRDGVRALASQTYPPYIHHSDAEDQQHPEPVLDGHLVREDPGQLGDGEHEDQVEEQLERADPQRGVSTLYRNITHRRAAMSRRYQPPRSETVSASS